MNNSIDTVDVQPWHWEFKEDNYITVRMWGFDKDSKPHVINFPRFPAFCQIQLPTMVGGKPFQWDENSMLDFFQFLCFRAKENAPFKYSPLLARELYYYQGNKYTQFMTVYFSTTNAMRKCANILRYPVEFRTRKYVYGTMKATAHELDVPLIRKMLTARNCKFSGWMRVTGFHPLPRDAQPTQSNNDSYYDEDDIIVKDVFGNVILQDAEEVFYQKSTFPREQEWIGDWTQLEMTPDDICKDWTTKPKLLGFDIEAYSDNHRIFPDKWNIKHVSFMISCVAQRAFEPETRIRYAIVLGRSDNIPPEQLSNCHIIEVKEELDLIDEMARIVREEDPDILLGYNIFDFDYPYLNSRLELSGRDWPNMGRIVDEPTYLHSMNWSSGGFGFNSINDLMMSGRISVDMYPVIKRSKKLVRYNLDTVASHLLKRKKHDVTAVEMFLTYERQTEAEEEYQTVLSKLEINTPNDKELFYRMVKHRLDLANQSIAKVIEELQEGKYKDQFSGEGDQNVKVEYNDPSKGPIYDRHGKLNWCSNQLWEFLVQISTDTVASCGDMPEAWAALTPPVLGQLQAGIFIMTRVTYYCLIDSDLCIDLFDQQNTWYSLTSLSEIAGVTVKDIFTRGQQVRTLSLLYDHASKDGVVLTTREAPEIDFTGGFVFNVVPGVYDGVAVVDFNSLYPSIMISYNLCYTTLIRPEHFYALPEEDVNTIAVPRPCDENYDLEDDEVDDNGERGLSVKQKVDQIEKSQKGVMIDREGKNFLYRIVKPPDCPECTPCADCNFIQEGRRKHVDCAGCVECTLQCVGPFKEDDPTKCNGCSVCKRAKATRCPQHQQCCKKYNVAPNRLRGLLPRILTELLDRRSYFKKQVFAYPKGHTMRVVNGEREIALKQTANSVYGFTGAAKMGKRPIMEVSTSTTAIGRQVTNYSADYCRQKYGMYVVYGDTDSIMVQLLTKDKLKYNIHGRALAKEISKNFTGILNLELEKVMKGIYICKKKYLGYVYEDDGTYKMDDNTGKPMLLIRGVILARRDNAKWLRAIYEQLVHMILNEATLYETISFVVENIKKLMAGEVHYDELVIVRGIGAYYKNETYFMKLFADNLARKGKPAKPGERLGYLVTIPTTPMEEKYIGNRMILPEEYEESQYTTKPYRLDYLYYLENQFLAALDQLIGAGYNQVFDKYSSIKFRPSKRCRFTQINDPVKMMVRMLKSNQDISKIVESIKAIDDNDPRGPVLQEEYESIGFEYPVEIPYVTPSKPRVRINVNSSTRPTRTPEFTPAVPQVGLNKPTPVKRVFKISRRSDPNGPNGPNGTATCVAASSTSSVGSVEDGMSAPLQFT